MPAPSGRTRSGTVAIVGRPNVGKSTLLNAALELPLAIVSPTPQTTRDTLLGVVHRRSLEGDEVELQLLDTPGLHKPKSALNRAMNRAARTAAEEADVIVFVTDLPPRAKVSDDTRLNPHAGDLALLNELGAGPRTVLVVNKVDNIKNKELLLPLLEALSRVRTFECIVPVCARRSDGIERVLDAVAPLLPEAPHRFGPDDVTDRPARWFAAEYVREQVLLRAREEVPHATAVSVEAYEPRGKAVRIAATVHVERPGHKKILIGARGEMLKQIGTDARVRIEELVGHAVHLELFVRVTPKWRDEPSMLEELGYGEAAP